VAACATAPAANAAWPGENGRIAWTRGVGAGTTAIWTMEPDGSDKRRLTIAGGQNRAPAWSPDGTRIVFSSDRDGDPDIWIMNADGSDQRRVTNDLAGEYRPSFSPDGRQVVYADDRGTTDAASVSELWAVGVDGSNPRPLTAAGQFASAAAWAPDGGTIAFAFRGPATGDATQLWRVPATGNNAIGALGTPVPGVSMFDPEWSPDGNRIAFWRDGGDIFSVDRTGGDLRELYGSPTFDADPAWAPDGLRVAFVKGGLAAAEINVAEPGIGSDSVPLTADPADAPVADIEPSWQPKVRPPTSPEGQPPVVPGTPAVDADGDGFTAAQGDCNDALPTVGPTAREVPGNGSDENCDGRSDPYPIAAGRATLTGQRDRARRRVNVLALRVIDLQGGETVTVSCAGRCSRNLRRHRATATRPGTLSLDRRVRRGWVRFGAALRVRIERAEHSTRIETFTMRAGGRVPWKTRRRCELPGGGADRDCDGAPDVPLLPARASLDTARRGRDTVLRRLRLRDLQGGEFVALACKGKSCARRLTRTLTVPAGTTRLRLDRTVRGIRLKPGARLELTVSKTGFVTAISRWTMRRGSRPRAARLCLEPGENRAGSCG
jgi:TolB protein